MSFEKLKFDFLADLPLNMRHDVFLRNCMTTEVLDFQRPGVKNHLPIGNDWARRPNDEFIEWAEENSIPFVVHSLWNDGCSLYLLQPEDAVVVKLRWGIKNLSC